MTNQTVSVRAVRRALMLSPMFFPEFKTVGGVDVPEGVGGRARAIWRDVVIAVADGEDFRDALRRESDHMSANGASQALMSDVIGLVQGEYAAASERVDVILNDATRYDAAAAAYVES